MNKYYSLVKNKKKREATLNIFGDITSYAWEELGQVSSYNLSKQLQQLTDVDTINVHINSYGGEVGEGLAIYNSLKNHEAKIKTYCDGFACSIASVIFMAGDERIMSNASLLMIHNAWSFVQGNAEQLRKQADDLDIITQASVNAYMNHVSISEKELKELLNNETWLDCNEALTKGFATKITESKDSDKASQNVKQSLIKMILANKEEQDNPYKDLNTVMKITNDEITIYKQEEQGGDDITTDEEGGDELVKFECQECGYIHEGELPEFFVCPECGADKEQFVEVEETETDDEEVVEEETQDEEETETTEENPDEGEEPKEDEKEDVDPEKENNEKAVAFFKAIIGGMK